MESFNRSIAVEQNRAGPAATAGRAPLSTPSSAVSWTAVIAGAAAAAALSLILLVLGTGLGMSAVSPWTAKGLSAASIGLGAILWLTFTQLAASGIGGYLAGRLRTQWIDVERDEIYFRDTAHGFLAWGVATLATASLLTSAIGSVLSSGIEAGSSLVGGAATTATAGAIAGGSALAAGDRSEAPLSYFVDSLFRNNSSASPAAIGNMPPNAASAAPEVARIFMNSLRSGALPAEDQRYVGQLVAERTGLSQQEAEKRVGETYARTQTKLRDAETAVKDAAEQARKASAYAALWLFISLLIGAFVASLAATYGGRQRDLPARNFS